MREIRQWMKKTKGTVTFQPGPFGGVIVMLSTPRAASVRRVFITTTSPEMGRITEAFRLARMRHTIKLAAATCVSREVDGKHS